MAKSTALERKDNFTTVRDMLNTLTDAISSALPKHLTAERQIRIASTGLQKNPALLDCTAHSIVSCIIQASQLGLEPDGVTGQAYLVPFNNTKTGQRECQLIPGYKGYLSLAYNSGQVDSVNAKVVHDGDKFQYNYGLNPDLIHVPVFDSKKRNVTHVYCVIKMKSGGHVFDVMSREEIEEHKKRYSHGAKLKGSVWEKEWESMAMKTVIRRTLKLVPQSSDLRLAITLDESAEVGMAQKFSGMEMGEILDVTTEQQTDQLKDKLEHQKKKTKSQSATVKSDTVKTDEVKTSTKTDEKVQDKEETQDTGKFEGDYEKIAIDKYNQLTALGGDAKGLLDQLTGNTRVVDTISDNLKKRVIAVFDQQIDELTPKQESILKETQND